MIIRKGNAHSKESISMLAIMIAIMPILDPYILAPGLGIGLCDIAILLMAAYMIIKNQISVFKPLFFLLIFDLVLTLISFTFTQSSHTDLLLALKVAIVFMLYLLVYSSIWSKGISIDFIKVVEIVGTICAALALLQFVFASMGFDFYDGRLFFPLGEGSYFGGLHDRNTGTLRVHSFFEEPSYLAFYELPVFAHFLQTQKKWRAALCAGACLVSGSMIGVLGVVIVLCAFVFFDNAISRKIKFRFAIALLITVALIAILYATWEPIQNILDYYIYRATSIDQSAQRADSSFSQRILGNYKLMDRYAPFNKVFGVGFNQYSLYFEIYKDYSNDFVSNLLNFGYIGFFALIYALITIAKKSAPMAKMFVLLFLMLLMVDHSWFGPMFFYVLSWIVVLSTQNNKGLFIRMRLH